MNHHFLGLVVCFVACKTVVFADENAPAQLQGGEVVVSGSDNKRSECHTHDERWTQPNKSLINRDDQRTAYETAVLKYIGSRLNIPGGGNLTESEKVIFAHLLECEYSDAVRADLLRACFHLFGSDDNYVYGYGLLGEITAKYSGSDFEPCKREFVMLYVRWLMALEQGFSGEGWRYDIVHSFVEKYKEWAASNGVVKSANGELQFEYIIRGPDLNSSAAAMKKAYETAVLRYIGSRLNIPGGGDLTEREKDIIAHLLECEYSDAVRADLLRACFHLFGSDNYVYGYGLLGEITAKYSGEDFEPCKREFVMLYVRWLMALEQGFSGEGWRYDIVHSFVEKYKEWAASNGVVKSANGELQFEYSIRGSDLNSSVAPRYELE
jgi:hypothetical protein